MGLASAGCSANLVSPSADGTADAEASTVAAIVTVDRTAGSSTENSGGRSDIIARFVRSHAGTVDDDALRMVGAAIDLPPAGACTRLPSANTSAPTKPGRSVELVNVGAVSVELSGVSSLSPLLPRHMPDVADVVSGVVYTARGDGDAFPARGRYVVHVAGAPEQDIAPFSVEATARGDLGDVRVADQAMLRRSEPLAIAAGDTTEITWTPSNEGSDDDLVYIEVAARPTGTATIRCSFADVGRATLPASTFAGDEGTLSVHRVHRETFHAKGVDSGVLRFDFARSASFRRSPLPGAVTGTVLGAPGGQDISLHH